MQTFWQLVRESIVVQAVITVVVVGGFVGDLLVRGEASPELKDLVWLVMGFYFGSKVTGAVMRGGGGGGA